MNLDYIKWRIFRKKKVEPSPSVPQKEEERFCSNCRWSRDTNKKIDYWTCDSPQNQEFVPNPDFKLDGKKGEYKRIMPYCEFLRRGGSHYCGDEGRWWDHK